MPDNPRYDKPPYLEESVTRLIAITITLRGPGAPASDVAQAIVQRLHDNGVEFVTKERVRSGGMEVSP